MTPESTTAALRQCVLFSSFSDLELEKLADGVQGLHYDGGDIVCREGETGDSLFVIVDGNVRVIHTNDQGHDQAIGLLGPGACLGEMSFLDGGPRSATVIATRPSTLLSVTHPNLQSLTQDCPETRIKVLEQGVRMLSARLRASNESYWDLANRSVRARMQVAESRSRLLSLVSHELRTPLTVIKASGQLIGRGAPGHEAEFARKIVGETEHLQTLIEDLIALCLLQSGAGAGEPAEIDASKLVAEIVSELSPLAERNRVAICAIGGGAVKIRTDRGLLRRALRHLVENAVKFSPAGGTVKVELDVEGDAVKIRIIDQGDGIDAAALERLRQSFVQDQDPLSRDVEGLGIGLPLAYEVVEALGGRLSASSSRGHGTCINIELPRIGDELACVPARERSIQHG